MSKQPRKTDASIDSQKADLKEIAGIMRLGVVYATSTERLSCILAPGEVTKSADSLHKLIRRIRLPQQVMLEVRTGDVQGFEVPADSPFTANHPTTLDRHTLLPLSRVESDPAQPTELYFGNDELVVATSALATALARGNHLQFITE